MGSKMATRGDAKGGIKIILEGPDNAGKSTIGKALSTALEIPLRGRITRVGPENVLRTHFDDTEMLDGILDRCYAISDIVYEPIFNGNQSILANVQPIIDYDLAAQGFIVVHVTCRCATLEKRFQEEGDEIYNFDQIVEVHQRYNDYFSKCDSTLRVITIDTTHVSVEDNVQAIIDYIKGEA